MIEMCIFHDISAKRRMLNGPLHFCHEIAFLSWKIGISIMENRHFYHEICALGPKMTGKGLFNNYYHGVKTICPTGFAPQIAWARQMWAICFT
jgi:hypothetical protein